LLSGASHHASPQRDRETRRVAYPAKTSRALTQVVEVRSGRCA
jgi:hypothetical protein